MITASVSPNTPTTIAARGSDHTANPFRQKQFTAAPLLLFTDEQQFGASPMDRNAHERRYEIRAAHIAERFQQIEARLRGNEITREAANREEGRTQYVRLRSIPPAYRNEDELIRLFSK